MQLKKFITNRGRGTQGPLPLLNTLFSQSSSLFGTFEKKNGYRHFMKWARTNPHVLGLTSIIVADILSDKMSFLPLKGNRSTGRNSVLKSDEFWRVNKGKGVVEEMLMDFLLLGVGYNWFGKVDDVELKEYCDIVAKEMYEGERREVKAKQMFEFIKKEQVSKLAKKFRYVAASTISITNDHHEIVEYVQKVGTTQKTFKPEEIIQYNFMPLDGGVYPYPPMESLIAEVYLLWLLTQNNISLFENGGSPDKVFILPKELAGSKNHEYLIETLKKYKKIQNKHGNLVFTGDIEIQDLMKVESQMENRDLSLYLTSVLAMFYGIPAGRIPFLIGKAANNGDAGGLADSGYWRKISFWQSKIEDGLNNSIFIQFFKTTARFGRGYKQDEIRETQVEMQKTQVAEQRINLGLWTPESAADYLGIDFDDFTKGQAEKKKRDEELASGMLNQNLSQNKNTVPEPDKQFINARRGATQNNNQMKAGGSSQAVNS